MDERQDTHEEGDHYKKIENVKPSVDMLTNAFLDGARDQRALIIEELEELTYIHEFKAYLEKLKSQTL